jgi:hypothetical protein
MTYTSIYGAPLADLTQKIETQKPATGSLFPLLAWVATSAGIAVEVVKLIPKKGATVVWSHFDSLLHLGRRLWAPGLFFLLHGGRLCFSPARVCQAVGSWPTAGCGRQIGLRQNTCSARALS